MAALALPECTEPGINSVSNKDTFCGVQKYEDRRPPLGGRGTNTTEGFGIVALAGGIDQDGNILRPNGGFLLAAFVGTIIGHGFTNEAISVGFLIWPPGRSCTS